MLAIIIINALFYIITLLFYIYKRRKIDCYFILLSLYAFVALLGIPEYIAEPELWHLRIWPYIYLYVIFLLFFRPLNFDSDTLYDRLQVNNLPFLKHISTFYIIISLFSIYCYLPVAWYNIQNGDWAQIRLDHYNNDIQLFDNQIKRFFANLFTHFRIGATVLLFYFFTLKDISIVRKILLTISVSIPYLLVSFTTASRDMLFDLFFCLLICYVIFRKGIPKKVKKSLALMSILLMVIIIIYSMAITLSRFGENGQSSSLLYYFSHSFMTFNYGLTDTIKNYLYGDLFFGRIFDFFTGESNIVGNLDKVTGTHMSTAFFTFVGAWYIDFGPIGAIIVAFIIPSIISLILKGKKQFNIAVIFAYTFYLSYLMRGVFVHPRGIAFNWFIAIILYLILKMTLKPRKTRYSYLHLTLNKTNKIF